MSLEIEILELKIQSFKDKIQFKKLAAENRQRTLDVERWKAVVDLSVISQEITKFEEQINSLVVELKVLKEED